MSSPILQKYPFLEELGLTDGTNSGVYLGRDKWGGSGAKFQSVNPSTEEVIGHVSGATAEELEVCVQLMCKSQDAWQRTPAPKRGEVVRQIGDELRKLLIPMGRLISLEMGKIEPEGIGEVQEIVDICDLAVGLSRQLEGKIFQSERPDHFLMEQYHPLGNVGIITAFNFPAAPLGWNLALSLICGNCNIWKGADTTPLTHLALSKIITRVLERNDCPVGAFVLCTGDGSVGEKISKDKRINLVSFTGSCRTGRKVGVAVQERFGKVLLELGGNNASVIMEDADLDLAVRGSLFGAVGTCGQRCTSLRRLLVHEKVYDEVKSRLVKAYAGIPIGDPLKEGTLCGPLHNDAARKRFLDAVKEAESQGGKILCGGKALSDRPGFFVQPAVCEISHDKPIVKEEVFGPLLHLIKISSLEEAIALNNSVPQGLSSSLYTKTMQHVFRWTGNRGSDCGLVNVNIGTSGAEIGGAFGGEKETGGGRESGSDAWKQYMRRVTCTVNFGDALPLAQGIQFG
uniref:aldehyde dehydrogenase (NAD(+)) n=1 Tax=Chromera velia CCMP2878 TaxID=1169474 RepID=A0A0G4G768_9ALVE|mmetsp:Transcript_55836/g.109296  ORF Transcript_55836/g.109296 Transcript_55836/m.109296 type:complete len:513 (-) Transcript_55836:1541-3079(-)|eukprot:Cvel_20542.t1-p1 / transcript=Cvel_20542.t1 / gene=Cvel_20542 / organism=Chromera_velia_CCMP2878 / gene_product=Aldehyde dehydrogenase family 7 member B4, putative / transcript_product=Aldehyde dehydrogenase family 7 member B4, putative / location=Cvel_scaffold1853:23851-28442(+) / protein_length=512 / sequence_SO=supercontig / SO=protein_coding / is_pseudo=false